MIMVDNVMVTDELLKVRFMCNLSACKGACCIEGDAGAPIEMEEIGVLEDVLDKVKPFITSDGLTVIENFGVFEYDAFGHFVTPLIRDKDCAFVVYQSGIATCAIELAFLAGKIKFRKPISCYLYPIRISKSGGIETLHYHRWSICASALSFGQQQMPAYQFLRSPLITKFGYHWYKKLEKLVAQQKQL